MSPEARTALAAYARAIERRWAALVERPVLLSQRDWEAIRDWHARGIPLEVVWSALDASGGPGRGRRSPPRSLAALDAAVDEEWRALAGGRLAERVPEAPAMGRPAPPNAWRLRRDAEPPESPLRALLERLLGRLDAGEPAVEIDRCLEEQLVDAAPADLLAAARAAVEGELEPHRARMPAAALAATSRRVLVLRLREGLGLPRLASPSASP